MIWAAADTLAGDPFAQYGLAGTLAAAIVTMALYILKDKNRQLADKDIEISRLRGELVETRKVLEPLAPALKEQAQSMNVAIAILERSKQVVQ